MTDAPTSPSPSASAPPPAPVAEAQRIVLLDVLRGFAVLGILLANIPFMSMAAAVVTPFGHTVGGDHWTDQVSYAIVFFFADTKFITIFSTLFGAGLGLMSEKAFAQNQPFGWRYTRRLFALFCIGWFHVLFLWFGDILAFYAMVGFVTMWFRGVSPKVLFILAGILLVLNGLLWTALGLIPVEMMFDGQGVPGASSFEEAKAEEIAEFREIFRSGDLGAMGRARAELHMDAIIAMMLVFGMRTLGLFLLGMAWIKAGGPNRFGMQRGPLFKVVAIGGSVGVVLHVVAFLCGWEFDTPLAQRLGFFFGFYFGGLFQAAAYVAVFALWMHTNLFLGLRARLGAVGRMALTNYLSHSLITGILFNYCGQYDQWRRPYLLLLVFGIFAFQLWLSPLWLRRFRYGPVEWIWRMATYMRPIAIRRS